MQLFIIDKVYFFLIKCLTLPYDLHVQYNVFCYNVYGLLF